MCVCVLFELNSVEKNANTKPEGMEGTLELPPTEKVILFNINFGLGHHADYATITILCAASMDPLHPDTDTRFPLLVRTRPVGIKTQAETQPCRRLHAEVHKHILTLLSTITILYEGLNVNPETSVPCNI